MANLEATHSDDSYCVFVETNFGTRLAILAQKHETVSDFKENFCKEHKLSFPDIGEINVSAIKVERRSVFYNLCDSINVSKAFEGTKDQIWFLYADVASADKSEIVAVMAADQKETPKGLETSVTKKTTKKRKTDETLDRKSSRKKLAPTSIHDVTDSLKACSQVQGGVAPDTLPKEKLQIDIGSGEGSSLAPGALKTAENQLEASCGLTTKKDSSKDEVLEIVMGEKSVEDVERGNIVTDSLVSPLTNQLEASTGPVSEKKEKRKTRSSKDQSIPDEAGSGKALPSTDTVKKRRKKNSSKDSINPPATIAGSLETVNESEKVSDHIDAEK